MVDGNRLIMTPYDLSFRKDKVDAKLCTKTLTQNEIMQLRKVSLLLGLNCLCCNPKPATLKPGKPEKPHVLLAGSVR